MFSQALPDYGEMYNEVLQGSTGYTYGGLAHLAYVAKRIEFWRRRQNLSWSHHREVAPLEPAEQDEWLDKAEQEGWAVHTLRQAIKESRANHPPWLKHTDVWNIPSCDDRFVKLLHNLHP